MLGAKHLWDNGQNPPTCLLSLGGAWVEIYPATSSRPETTDNKLAGFRHLALRVASLDAAKAEFEQRGVKFNEETSGPRRAAARCYSLKTPRETCSTSSNAPLDFRFKIFDLRASFKFTTDEKFVNRISQISPPTF